MHRLELCRISRNPELSSSHEQRGYWPKLRPVIHGPELGVQACVPSTRLEPLRLESEFGLIRAVLAEAREITEELRQKAVGSSNRLDRTIQA